jgi:hypothetical protein
MKLFIREEQNVNSEFPAKHSLVECVNLKKKQLTKTKDCISTENRRSGSHLCA